MQVTKPKPRVSYKAISYNASVQNKEFLDQLREANEYKSLNNLLEVITNALRNNNLDRIKHLLDNCSTNLN